MDSKILEQLWESQKPKEEITSLLHKFRKDASKESTTSKDTGKCAPNLSGKRYERSVDRRTQHVSGKISGYGVDDLYNKALEAKLAAWVQSENEREEAAIPKEAKFIFYAGGQEFDVSEYKKMETRSDGIYKITRMSVCAVSIDRDPLISGPLNVAIPNASALKQVSGLGGWIPDQTA